MADPAPVDLEDFRENWMTELALKKSGSQQPKLVDRSEKSPNPLLEHKRGASVSLDQLTRSLSQASLGPPSNSSSPSKKGKEKKDDIEPKSVKELAIEAYVAGSRFER